MEKLDRSRVRLVQIELASYEHYLEKWPDGAPRLHPLVWAYDHPEDPVVPSGIHAFRSTADIEKAYAAEAEMLSWLTWRPVPSNAVPTRIEIAGKKLIPSQFLALMVEAYLAPTPETGIKLRYFQPFTAPGHLFPRQNTIWDGGHISTLRPAPLDLSQPKM
jgi:hypothetical protein